MVDLVRSGRDPTDLAREFEPSAESIRYRTFLDSPRCTAGLRNSLIVAGLATVISVAFGTALAVALVRRRLRALEVVARLATLPLFVPPVVLGMALLPFVRATGLWGTHLSLAAAHALLSLPVVVLVPRGALEALDPDLTLAAHGRGASPWRIFRRVTLPLVAPAVMIGALMAFVFSLNEFVVALFLATPSPDTLHKVIWPNLRRTLTPLTAAASAITVAVTLAGLLVAGLVLARHAARRNRKMGV